MKDEAITTAEAVVAQAIATRSVYTKEVISKSQSEGVNILFGPKEYRSIKGFLPLPATMLHMISDEVSEQRFYAMLDHPLGN